MGKHRVKEKKPKKEKVLDSDTVAAAREVENRMRELAVELRVVDAKAKRCAADIQKADLTSRQIQPMLDMGDTALYRHVGKAFFAAPSDELVGHLKAARTIKSVEERQLQMARAALERRMQAEGAALKELLGADRVRRGDLDSRMQQRVFQSDSGRGGCLSLPPNEAGAAPFAEGSAPVRGLMPLYGRGDKETWYAGSAAPAGAPRGGVDVPMPAVAAHGGFPAETSAAASAPADAAV